MRIRKVHIKNFRSFRDCEVEFDNFTSLVGANGAGKSTVLCALNVFFRETESAATNLSELDEEDFHARNTSEPIEITVTFDALSEQAIEDFSQYARQGILIVTAKAEFDETSRRATVKQFGQRMGMEAFRPFFEKYGDSAPAADLKAQYNALRETHTDLPAWSSKDAGRDSLKAYEAARPNECVPIPSEDQFYGFTKGGNRIAKYIQWVYLPAVKDATKENTEGKNNALGKILARTVRSKVKFDEQIQQLRDDTQTKYREIMAAQQSALNEISASLTARLGQWAHPDAKARLEWREDEKKSVQVEEPVARLLTGEGEFEGDLARFGHGLQRSYLLALLQELANTDDDDAPRLVLACEEPELYQHPPQARHLSSVLQELSEGNAQIMVSTHSPYFITGRHFESVRMVRRHATTKCSEVARVTSHRITERRQEVSKEPPTPVAAEIARLHQALQPNLNEMFFTPRLILVEGLEDVAFITSWLILTNRWEAYRRGGYHIIPVNGKNHLIEPLILAQELGISTFVVFDADGNTANPNNRIHHERDNKTLLRLLGGDDSNPFPTTTVWNTNCVIWPHNFGDALKTEIDSTVWDRCYGQANASLGNPQGSYGKNMIHIGTFLSIVKNEGINVPTLDQLCESILGFAT